MCQVAAREGERKVRRVLSYPDGAKLHKGRVLRVLRHCASQGAALPKDWEDFSANLVVRFRCAVILVVPSWGGGGAQRVPNYPEGAKLQKERIQRVL